MLPPSADNAGRLCRERLKELAAFASALLIHPLPEPVKSGCRHLGNIAEGF
jgi:hypothetical protein